MIWDYARTPQQHQTLPALGQYLVWTAKPVTGSAPPAVVTRLYSNSRMNRREGKPSLGNRACG